MLNKKLSCKYSLDSLFLSTPQYVDLACHQGRVCDLWPKKFGDHWHTGLRRSYGGTSSRGRCSAAAFLNPDVRGPCLSVSSYRHLIVDSKGFSPHTHRIKVSASYVALVDT